VPDEGPDRRVHLGAPRTRRPVALRFAAYGRGFVTAPSLAELTRAAYFASTPVA
jgi:hypothetical protein